MIFSTVTLVLHLTRIFLLKHSRLRRRWCITNLLHSNSCTYRKLILPGKINSDIIFLTQAWQKNTFLHGASTNLTLYISGVCDWETVLLWFCGLSVCGLHSCTRPLGEASVLSPAQQTAPLLPPTAPDISYQSHYRPQEVVPKLPPPHQATNPHLHLSLIRLERHLIHADHSNLLHLEGWIRGTHSCFTASLIEPRRLWGDEAGYWWVWLRSLQIAW